MDSPGPITAGKKLGDIIVAYKESAMYVGQYVGAPLIWDFRRVPGDIGTPVQEAVVSTGTAHFFIGPDDFYMFDGSRPTALNSPVRNWFFNNVNRSLLYKTCGTFDRVNQRAYWWFVSSCLSSGTLDKCIVYNVKTNQWGKIHKSIEYVAEYITAGMTYEGLGTAYSTYDDLPTYISYNSPFWNSGGSVVTYFGTDHKAYQLSGVSGESSIVTGHYGDNINYSTIEQNTPAFYSYS